MSSSTSNHINSTGNVASYKWIIANFSNSTKLKTPNFSFPIDNGNQFRLFFNPSLSNLWGDNWTSISINLESCNQDKLKVKHRMWIVNANGDKCNTQEGISVIKKYYFGVQYNIHRVVLMDSDLGLLVNDTLSIVCEIELVNGGENAPSTASYEYGTISQHYESLLESGKHSDVVLSVGEKKFRAHKLVLCARSPVFAAMFEHANTKEAQQGRVDIVDVEVEVFELFLRYIYTGKIDSLDRFAPELFAVADMYQMDCLKSLFEHYLCSTLTIDNVSQLLIHADLYRAEVLKSKCIDYITDNPKKVKATEGWKAVATNADLLDLLFDKLSIKFDSVCSK